MGARSKDSSRTPYSRTPTFLRPVEDEEHEMLTEMYKGLVQFFTSSCANDWERPWSKSAPRRSEGSGFIIDVCVILSPPSSTPRRREDSF